MSSSRIGDVAALAGVSVGTVSNVLNGRGNVSPETIARVRAAIDELGYVRNDAARQLRAGRSTSIGLVVMDVGNPFFTDVARGAEEEAAQSRLAVILGNSDESRERELAYLDLFEAQRVQGVLISPVGEVEERLRRLRERGTGVVLVDRASEEGSLSSVAVDDVAGGRLAVEHLLATGRRRIAFVGGAAGVRQVADRLAGARSAAREAGFEVEAVPTSGLTVLEGRRVGAELSGRRPRERPDAVFAANDLVAVGLLQALVMTSRLRVPDDIAIVGYDDIDFASATVVPLTSVAQPSRVIGATAVRVLLEEADDPKLESRQVVFQPELVVRASTRPPG